MALFMKQDFSPPILSRKWVALKLRSNKLIYTREHIITILESGLLFREDCAEVEQEAPDPEQVWAAAGGGRGGWVTRGERTIACLGVGATVALFPPRSLDRSTLILLASYASVPLVTRWLHRRAARRTCLGALVNTMRQYVALARRAAACLKECGTVHKELSSIASVLSSMRSLLCRQQSELSVLLSRASSALLGNLPWVRSDVAWEAVEGAKEDNLLKIHHTFLVVQSTFLKHIAMAHYIPSVNAQRMYKNHNERLYWIHTVLLEQVLTQFNDNFEALERMYRLVKNYGSVDLTTNKTPGSILNDTWLYSEVHSGIAKANLELKIALSKCTSLDMLLDSCALNKQEIDLAILNTDIDDLIDKVTQCLSTAQSSQLRLKKLKCKFGATKCTEAAITNVNEKVDETKDNENVVIIVDKDPETRDEVFYFVKTDDDNETVQPAVDVTTQPGKKEKETTKIVLNELKRKLVRREDVMRERERQALAKSMPDLKNNLPEFPRQIDVQYAEESKGFISKLKTNWRKRKLFRKYKINKHRSPEYCYQKCSVKNETPLEGDTKNVIYEALVNIQQRSKRILTFDYVKPVLVIETHHTPKKQRVEFDSDLSEGMSDVETNASNAVVNHAVNTVSRDVNTVSRDVSVGDEARNVKFCKEDLELSPSSSESDLDFNEGVNNSVLLKDIRRHRAVRKKNYPVKRGSVSLDIEDESLRPVEYSFGTGMAIASFLQANPKGNLTQEEVFVGDGEVSEDSGNDEDA